MNNRSIFAALTLLVPLAAGCAGRTAPFNEMDKAQITVLRLSQPPPPVAPMAGPTGIPGLPAIPGFPPEMTAMGNQLLQGAAAALPAGLLPPGLIPGTTGMPAAPVQPPAPLYKNSFSIVAQMQLTDEALRDEVLDILGHEDSFTGQPGQCFTPGMAFSMVRPGVAPADVMVSLTCNQAKADGFQWPYKTNGFSPEALSKMSAVYTKLWGPVPAGA